MTACQCGTYDEIKGIVIRNSGWGDCLATHLTSSTLAGLIATTVTNPIDVVKTVVFVSEFLVPIFIASACTAASPSATHHHNEAHPLSPRNSSTVIVLACTQHLLTF